MQYRVSGIRLLPGENESLLLKKAAKELSVFPEDIVHLSVYRKSLDARKGKISFLYTVTTSLKQNCRIKPSRNCQKVALDSVYSVPVGFYSEQRPLVVGFGPAGMFASLLLARAGLSPIVVERGKKVEDRQRDVQRFFDGLDLVSESNIQFGEGGAGTFSDGKLNTLLKDKNFRGRFVLEEFVKAGAPEEILYLNKPHIGTDRLRLAVRGIREEICRLGGTFHFESKFLEPVVCEGKLCGAKILFPKGEKVIECSALFLGIGHSARDTFRALRNSGIQMEKKIFSIGVRIEHLQEKINCSQYGKMSDSPFLPTADYKLAVPTSGGKTLYSFCMCPGGVVVPAASEENGVVTNGMSYFARDGKNANSALLLNVLPEELDADLFSGFDFQRSLEEKAYLAGGGDFKAPCQLVGDFLSDQSGDFFGSVLPTYSRGVKKVKLDSVLPKFYCDALKEGIIKMGQLLVGFDDAEALLTGVESRATCPVRIVRGESYQSSLPGLYPIGEGAGYAGGIMSSAMDGMKAAETYIKTLGEKK